MAKSFAKIGSSQARNLSGMMRGSSGGPAARSESRGKEAYNRITGKGFDHGIGFQGLDQAKVNCNSPLSCLVLSSSTVAARGGHPPMGESYQGSTGITGHSVSPHNLTANEGERLPPATGGSGASSKKQRMKMLNMSKINGPAATSFYYPQSTRAGSRGQNNSSMLGSTPGGLSSTLKTAVSGKALFPDENRPSPPRTAVQPGYNMPPRGGLSGSAKLSGKLGAKLGTSSMTYSDLSGLHYRYQSPASGQAKPSVANSTITMGKQPKYPHLEGT